MNLPPLNKRVLMSLAEDGAEKDLTTMLLPDASSRKTNAILLAKASGVYCGGFLLGPIFKELDSRVSIREIKRDGDRLSPGEAIARIRGSLRALLAGERLFLNLACRLSGIATLTRAYVDRTQGSNARIYDTRKTTPLWRDLERFAVEAGGGHNHRFSLSEAILIKDNHVAAVRETGQSLPLVFGRARVEELGLKAKFIEIEAATLKDVYEALDCDPDIILLDNMPVKLLKESIAVIKLARSKRQSKRPLIEISGGVRLENVAGLSRLGVDRISVGALTHSATALDMSLEVQ